MQSSTFSGRAPRVFISYAWEDDHYREWVISLCTQLRSDNIDVRLDKWHLERGVTIPEFMNREVRLANIVLVLCSPKYRIKVHEMEERLRSTGAGWEAMLIGAKLFTTNIWEKIEVALARGVWAEAAPDFLLGLPYIDLSNGNEANYKLLKDRLAGCRQDAPILTRLPTTANLL